MGTLPLEGHRDDGESRMGPLDQRRGRLLNRYPHFADTMLMPSDGLRRGRFSGFERAAAETPRAHMPRPPEAFTEHETRKRPSLRGGHRVNSELMARVRIEDTIAADHQVLEMAYGNDERLTHPETKVQVDSRFETQPKYGTLTVTHCKQSNLYFRTRLAGLSSSPPDATSGDIARKACARAHQPEVHTRGFRA